MNFKVKIFAGIILATVIAVGTSLVIHEVATEKLIWEQSRSKGLSIVSTAARQINGDDIEEIHRTNDENSELYKRVQKTLQDIRNANRRKDAYVQNLYTLRYVPNNPSLIEFGVDAEEDLHDHSRIGDVDRARTNTKLDLVNPKADEDFTNDQWGSWLSASAPIFNSSGKAVAILGLDVPAERLRTRIADERRSAISAFLFTLCISILVSAGISRAIARPLYALNNSIKEIEKGNFEVKTGIKSRDEFGLLAGSIEHMAESMKQNRVLKSAFASYVSNQVMDTILKSESAPNPQGERKAVTVLFSDIRGFTDLSESLTPEKVVELLNEYFERMIEVVFKHGGTLDKFIGDGLMAIFGAPLADPNHEENAVRAALDMQRELSQLQTKWAQEGKRSFQIGIGINSGKAIVGNIGSSQRLQYTAIGDTVNIAARLESATKDHGVTILLSEYTYNAIRRDFVFQKIGALQVKGRKEEIVTYSVEGAVA